MKRKQRKNTTKGWFPKVSTLERPIDTREQIMQESPGILMEEGISQEGSFSQEITTSPPRKMTPKKAKRNLND